MGEKTKDIDIPQEQEKIRDKIGKINKSGIYHKIKNVLNNFRKQLRVHQISNVRLEGRVKKRRFCERENRKARGIS